MSSKKLIKIEIQKAQILEELLKERLMLPGAFGVVYCKCGKDNCWCKKGVGHPVKRITWTEKGKSKTKTIPEQDARWIKEVTKNYRNFKKMKRKLKTFQMETKAQIEKWEKKLIKKTRQMRTYLKKIELNA